MQTVVNAVEINGIHEQSERILKYAPRVELAYMRATRLAEEQ